MKAQVIFTHDDSVGKWEATVVGVENPTEARQAFSAVILTCQMLNPELLTSTQVEWNVVDRHYVITPAV